MTKLLRIPTQNDSRTKVLEKIRKYIVAQRPRGTGQKNFLHIVSLNPENLVEAQSNPLFNEVLTAAQIRIVDGVGAQFGAWLRSGRRPERIAGVDLMDRLIKMAEMERLKALLIGGAPSLADRVVDCYLRKYKNLRLKGTMGIENIKNPKKIEEERIWRIVRDWRPHLIFVAFGSPEQELWLYRNRERLDGIVCMGVGGAFDFLSGRVPRAPRILRAVGLEWLFRLIMQPWRVRRQVRLIQFIWLLAQDKLKSKDKR